MDQPLDEGVVGGERRVEPRRVHHDIIFADRLPEVPLAGILGGIRLRCSGRHRCGLHLPLGAGGHLLLFEIIGELGDHLSPGWHLGERRRMRLEPIHLLDEPSLGIGRHLIVGPCSQAEAVERDGTGEHPRLLLPLYTFNSAEPAVKPKFTWR